MLPFCSHFSFAFLLAASAPNPYSTDDQPYDSEALEPVGGWSKRSDSKEEKKREDEAAFDAEPLEPSVWTFTAKVRL